MKSVSATRSQLRKPRAIERHRELAGRVGAKMTCKCERRHQNRPVCDLFPAWAQEWPIDSLNKISTTDSHGICEFLDGGNTGEGKNRSTWAALENDFREHPLLPSFVALSW
ncbi:hypothetical protein BPAE_0025g00580 [Botrytis paeoniae]|uniref:Uncharacterized protein n=1 Tax=Botrytis paeoniae TaxID=278948 RepID=A0A4Z1G0S4_9HELO|nr:hypothetical protein BPAE_0025g00580 [Botrytis paeoniae]